jgi:hypothetical protein
MLINIKYFYENSNIDDYDKFNILVTENKDKIVFFPHELPFLKQIVCIINDITENKEILVIHFPTYKIIKKNKIIKNVISGKGIPYTSNKTWFPKEIWIYNPVEN